MDAMDDKPDFGNSINPYCDGGDRIRAEERHQQNQLEPVIEPSKLNWPHERYICEEERLGTVRSQERRQLKLQLELDLKFEERHKRRRKDMQEGTSDRFYGTNNCFGAAHNR